MSVSADMKYGEDPALSDVAKQARKAGKKLLAAVIKEASYATTAAFFSNIMRDYAALGMVEESSLIAAWWTYALIASARLDHRTADSYVLWFECPPD